MELTVFGAHQCPSFARTPALCEPDLGLRLLGVVCLDPLGADELSDSWRLEMRWFS